MSRIANTPIRVPKDVQVSVQNDQVRVSGPRGQLGMQLHSSVDVRYGDELIECSPKAGAVGAMAQAGTARSLISNMVIGEGTATRRHRISGATAGECIAPVVGILACDRV